MLQSIGHIVFTGTSAVIVTINNTCLKLSSDFVLHTICNNLSCFRVVNNKQKCMHTFNLNEIALR